MRPRTNSLDTGMLPSTRKRAHTVYGRHTHGSRLERRTIVTITVKVTRLIGQICEEGGARQSEADALGPFDPL